MILVKTNFSRVTEEARPLKVQNPSNLKMLITSWISLILCRKRRIHLDKNGKGIEPITIKEALLRVTLTGQVGML